MKKMSNKRLGLDRETVRTLVVGLSTGQLRYAGGGAPNEKDTEGACNSSEPNCGGCSSTGVSRH